MATDGSAGWPLASQLRRSTYGGADHTLQLSEYIEWPPNWQLFAGLPALDSKRRAAVVRPMVSRHYQRNRLAWAPRFGISYDLVF